MKYDDLEKTKELFEIDEDVPTPIENIEMEGISKNTVTDEFTLNLTDKEKELTKKNSETIKEEPKEEKKSKSKKDKKEKKSLKEKWQGLNKKQKILTIFLIILVLIIIIILILLLVLKNDKKKPVEKPKEPEKPTVIIEKENYIYKDGKLSLIDKDDNELGIYECKNKDENLCFVSYFSNEDEFDISKNIYEDESLIERRSPIFNDNYVFISDNNSESSPSIILYNISEQKEEGTYSLVKGFKDSNYVIVKDSTDKYGALEITSEGPIEKIKLSFDYLGIISNESKVVAKTNNKYFIYNREGKLESKALNYPIKNYNNSYIVIENNGESLYDYKAKQVIEGTYDYIDLLDNYVGLVSDNKLFIKDYKNNKYNEEGIELFNDNYNELNIYNKENVLQNTKYSYKINVFDDSIEILYLNKNDKEKNINISINEGKLSSNFNNLNYLNGKLYFYKEENKKTLLGTYSCTNKNTVEKDTNTLNNCFVASNKENTGWLPIINERYIFIVDSLDKDNKTFMLYDLKNSKTLSRYSSVDFEVNTAENKINFISNNNLYIIAENKSNKFGVIKIEEEVKSVIPFNYSKITKNKNNYIGNDSNNYVIFDNKGTKIASSEKEIIDYNNKYLNILDNNKYYVTDYSGQKVDNTGYLHITLEENYYVVITEEKKLNIKEYNNPNFSIATPLDVETDDFNNAYKVGKNSIGYLITITKTGKVVQIDNEGKVVG